MSIKTEIAVCSAKRDASSCCADYYKYTFNLWLNEAILFNKLSVSCVKIKNGEREKFIYDRFIYFSIECSNRKWCNTSHYGKLEALILMSQFNVYDVSTLLYFLIYKSVITSTHATCFSLLTSFLTITVLDLIT